MNEHDILERIKNGDIEAFEELYNGYQKKALQMAYLMTGNQSIALDIVQESFVECYLSLKHLKEPACFGTWFYKIVTRTASRCIKKEKKLVPTEGIEELVDANKNYMDSYGENELSELIISHINKMSYKKRATLILYYYNELSIKEIAKVMSCLEGTVKSRLNSGRQVLKKSLADEYCIEKEKERDIHEMVTEHRQSDKICSK